MHCPYCKEWLGEFDNAAFHECDQMPPTNWLNVIRWVLFIVAIVVFIW